MSGRVALRMKAKDPFLSEQDETIALLQKVLTAVTGGALLRDSTGDVLHNSLRFEARKLVDEAGDDVEGMELELPGDQRIAMRRRVLGDGSTVVWAETITELHRAEEELFRVYYTDELTGLDNRKGIERAGQNALELYQRYKRPMSILRIDIVEPADFDERPNRDQLVKHVGRVVGHALRLVDQVARLRGGAFLALMPETDAKGAAIAAKRLVERVARSSVQQDGQTTTLQVAAGVATASDDVESFDALIDAATLALNQDPVTTNNDEPS